jgi:hypothetical protein
LRTFAVNAIAVPPIADVAVHETKMMRGRKMMGGRKTIWNERH